MSTQLFSFQRPPFAAFPDPLAYYPAESAESARQTVLHVLRHETGIPLIFGESGTGKSLLLRVLKQQIEGDCHVVYMANARLRAPKALYQHLLFAVHQSYCGMQENELRLLFLDYLRQENVMPLVLLIDEAHSLTRSVLEELRVLLHYNEENSMRIRLVLAGTHQFEERLTHPHLDTFQQHVVARCYLENFRWNETSEEIVWQLHKAGCETPGSLFLPEARKAVHKLTEGLPRTVHQLCRRAIDCAVELGTDYVDESLVQKAWAKLQQLPGCESQVSHPAKPFVVETTVIETAVIEETVERQTVPLASVMRSNQSSLIEFGTLDDDEPENNVSKIDETKLDAKIESQSEPVLEAHDRIKLEMPVEPAINVAIAPIVEADTDINPIYRRPVFDSDLPMLGDSPLPLVEGFSLTESEEQNSSFVCEWDTLDEALSEKTVIVEQAAPSQGGESCQRLLDELSVMEHLLTQEITVINRMKQIEKGCISRRVRQVSPTQILAGFPEICCAGEKK